MHTFLSLYRSNHYSKSKLIRDITHGCDIADSTFFTKMAKLEAGDTTAFSKLEREWIGSYLNISPEILFPRNQKNSPHYAARTQRG